MNYFVPTVIYRWQSLEVDGSMLYQEDQNIVGFMPVYKDIDACQKNHPEADKIQIQGKDIEDHGFKKIGEQHDSQKEN